MNGSYKSISLKKLYIAAIIFCGLYIIMSVLSYILSGTIADIFVSDAFKSSHLDLIISGKCKALLCFSWLPWIPFIIYIISCTGWAFSAKRCKRTLKVSPALWILGFVAEHAFALWVSNSSMTSGSSEKLLIQRTEYATFFFSILLIGALVLVCTAAALGIDEDRHVKHLKYK